MQNFINVHCHLLNFMFVPDSFFKVRAPIREWMLRHCATRWLTRVIALFMKGRKYGRLHEALVIMEKDINIVAQELVKEMEEAGIVLSTPLMMDLEIASFGKKPEIPYRYQVKMISDISVKHPGKIIPFIMFDPRRRSVSELIKKALDDMGFLGVKMYPPLGYHPDPASFYNDADVNDELDVIYQYCEKNAVPITTHCSPGGAYSSELIHCRELVHEFCHPSSWEVVLKNYPNLYLNFAHFGGDENVLAIENPKSWSNTIKRLTTEYKHVYTDISYHDKALGKKTSGAYFKAFNALMSDEHLRDRIIFGTDWLMTRHTWKEKAFADAFRNLSPEMLEQVAFRNPLNFLFPGKKMPQRIKQFYKSNHMQFPKWMKEHIEC